MKLHARVTRSAVELVKRFEGLRRTAAQLPDGRWTVGYGHIRSAREGAVVTAEDAEALLYFDLSEVAEKIDAWTFTALNQNQFEALTAFAFNIGVENFRTSSVLKRINEGQHLSAAAALELWRKAEFDGETLVIDALVRRRAAEKAYYLTPPEGFRPSPSPVLRPTYDHSVVQVAANAKVNRTAVIDTEALDEERVTFIGPDAQPPAEMAISPQAQGSASEPDACKDAPFPYVALAAAPAVTPLATARLHQLFPEKIPAWDAAATIKSAVATTTAAPFAASVASSKELDPFPTAEVPPTVIPEPQIRTSLDKSPPPQKGPEPFIAGATNAAPLPVRPFDAPPPFPELQSATAPEAPASNVGRLLGAVSAPSEASTPVRSNGSRDELLTGSKTIGQSAHKSTMDFADSSSRSPFALLHNRTTIYSLVGILGLVLFAVALFSMLSGKATSLNLVIGLMGILLMTPAGGYFLLHFLNRRDGLIEA